MCKPTVPFDSLLSPMTRRALYFCHQLCLTKQLAGFLQALWLCLAWCPQQVPHVPACLTIMHFKHCVKQQAVHADCPSGTVVNWWPLKLDENARTGHADVKDRSDSGDIAGSLSWLPRQLCKKAKHSHACNAFSCFGGAMNLNP